MTEIGGLVFAALIWPGLMGAATLGLFYIWLARKTAARLQGRRGPPFYQPFFDIVKLSAKTSVTPAGVNRPLFLALPYVTLTATLFALTLTTVPGGDVISFPGDVILLIYLIEVPMMCEVMAGYVSRSIYGQVSAMREAILSFAYNIPLLAAIIAVAQAAESFRLAEIQAAPIGIVTILAGIAFLIAIPARLKSNPFSIPNAEHEIAHGAHMEYSGPSLAAFELAHALELVLIINVFFVLFVRGVGDPLIDALLYLGTGLVIILLVTVMATMTARLTLKTALRFYLTWGGIAAGGAITAAIVV